MPAYCVRSYEYLSPCFSRASRMKSAVERRRFSARISTALEAAELQPLTRRLGDGAMLPADQRDRGKGSAVVRERIVESVAVGGRDLGEVLIRILAEQGRQDRLAAVPAALAAEMVIGDLGERPVLRADNVDVRARRPVNRDRIVVLVAVDRPGLFYEGRRGRAPVAPPLRGATPWAALAGHVAIRCLEKRTMLGADDFDVLIVFLISNP